MSIASEIAALAANKAAIKSAIEAKNPATAPTDALAQWPTAIASIPTGGGEWQPPSDWPDIKAALTSYPTGATPAESNALVFLFECSNATSIRMRCGTSYRFSDSPTVVETAANKTTYVYHSVPEGTQYLWVIAYASDFVFFGDTANASCTNDNSNYSSYPILWIVGKGDADARGWGTLAGCRAIESGSVTFNIRGGGGGYLQNSFSLAKWSSSSVSPSVTSLRNAFTSCVALESIMDGSLEWDVSSITNLYGMFSTCRALKKLDLSSWDVSNVTDFSSMFYQCNSLTSLDVSKWDTSSATNMSNMFFECCSLKVLDLTSFDMSKVTGTSDMLSRDTALSSLIGGRLSPPTADPAKGPRLSINLSSSAALDRPSLIWFISWLSDLNTLGLSSQTLTLSAVAKTILKTSEIAVATAKGWTIA